MNDCVCNHNIMAEERCDGLVVGEVQCVDPEFVFNIEGGTFTWCENLQKDVTYTLQNSFVDLMSKREMDLMDSVGHIALKSDLIQQIWQFSFG